MTHTIVSVLLIEDNPGDVLLIRELLAGPEDLRFDIREAGKLSDGLDLLKKDLPHVILLDLHLPDSTGIGTLDAILQEHPRLPVIVLTGMSDYQLGIQAINRGAQDFLVKGDTDRRLLTKAIQYAIERKHAATESEFITHVLATLNRPNNWQHLIEDILQQIREFTGHEGIGLRLQQGADYPFAHTIGYPGDFIRSANSLTIGEGKVSSCPDPDGHPALACLCGLVIEKKTGFFQSCSTQRGSFWTNQLQPFIREHENRIHEFFLKEHCLRHGFSSLALIPVKSGARVLGLLQIVDSRPGRFTPGGIRFLEDIGEILGVAFHRVKNHLEIMDAEERFRTIFDNMVIGVYRTTPAGEILLANPCLLRMLGFGTLGELQQRNLEKEGFEPEYNRAEFRERLEREGSITGLESAWHRADKSVLYIRENARIIRDETGEVKWYEGTVEDITERKLAEESIRKSEARYRDIFTHAPVGICQVSPDGAILSANQLMADILGYNSPDEIMNLTLSKNLYWNPSKREEVAPLIESADTVQNLELLWKRHDGTPVWIDLTAHAIRDDRGNTRYFEGFISDITERKKAEENLKALNAASMNIQRALTQDEIFAGIVPEIHSLEGHCAILYLDASRQTVSPKYTSYESIQIRNIEKILGIKIEDLTIPVQSVPEFQEVISRRMTVYVQETKAFVKNIEPRPLRNLLLKAIDLIKVPRFILAPLIENDMVIGVFSLKADRLSEKDIPAVSLLAHQISAAWSRAEMFEKMNREIVERQKAETALVRSKERAEESDRLKTSLLNNLNHEFRTPMNAILGFSSLIAADAPDPDHQSMASRINQAGNRLMHTLDHILELSLLRASVADKEVNPLVLSAEIEKLFPALREEAGKKNLQARYRVKGRPAAAISAEHLNRMIHHLVDNAIKFTQEGTVAVEVGRQTHADKRWVAIAVSDTGIGIPDEHQSLIFEEFRQASEGYGRSYEGTGLGLTIARRIAEVYGGTIGVDSKPGKGSTFTVLLPAVEITAGMTGETGLPDTAAARDSLPEPATESMPIRTARNLRILVVEDNQDNAEMIRIYLGSGAAVEVVTDAASAIATCLKKSYDLVLMDIHLGPGENGMEATRKIRLIPAYERVPVIAVTGYTTSADKNRIFSSGCTHYLGKPFTKNQLLHIIQEAVPEPANNLS